MAATMVMIFSVYGEDEAFATFNVVPSAMVLGKTFG